MKRVTYIFNFNLNNSNSNEIREDGPLEIPPPPPPPPKHPRIEEADDDDDDEESNRWHTPSEDESWSDLEGRDDDDNEPVETVEDVRRVIASMQSGSRIVRKTRIEHGVARDFIYLEIRRTTVISIKFPEGFAVSDTRLHDDTFFVDGANASIEPTTCNVVIRHERNKETVYIFVHRPASLFFFVAEDLILFNVCDGVKEKKLFYEKQVC